MNAPNNVSLYIRTAFVILVAATTITCSSDSGTGPEEKEPQLQTLSISLAASSGATASRVIVNGIPDNVVDVYGVITLPPGTAASRTAAQAADENGLAFIDRSGDEDEIIIPLHPAAPMTGGEVNLMVTNGSNVTSNTVRLRIEPLPEAPGEFAALVTEIQALLDRWLEQQGTTRQILSKTPVDSLSLLHVPALFVYNVLDNPDNPNSLRALADGDIPYFADEPIDRDVLDAVTARARLREMTADKMSFVDTLTTPPDAPALMPVAAMRSSLTSSRACITGPTFDIGPDDCALLAEIMCYQTELELDEVRATEKYESDLIDIGMSLLGALKLGAVTTGIGTSMWAVTSIESGHKDLYPSHFISDQTDFKLAPDEFPEDFTAPGHWSEFKVTAMSNGWNFSEILFQAIEKMIAAGSGLDGSGAITEFDYKEKYKGMVEGEINNSLKQALLDNLPGDLEYCPQTWPGIDCTGKPHSVGTSPTLDYNSDDLSYKPKEVGTANLLVETLPVFGLGKITGETKQVETKRLEVFIDPFQATKDVNKGQTFTARVANAVNQEVEWNWDGRGDFTPNGQSAILVTPGDPWNPPIEVTAKSKSFTGLRKDKVDTDPRIGNALTTYGGDVAIEIQPRSVCIGNDSVEVFTAVVSGVENPNVIWKKEYGFSTLTPNGMKASVKGVPNNIDDTRISARVETPVDTAIAYADIHVSACNCRYSIQVFGDAFWNVEGHEIAYTRSDVLQIIQWIIEFPDEAGNSIFAFSLVPEEGGQLPEPGNTNPDDLHKLSATFSNASQAWSVTPLDSVVSMNLSILEYTPTSMTGIVSGNAVQRNDPKDRDRITSSVTVNMTFRAGLFVDGSWPCE